MSILTNQVAIVDTVLHNGLKSIVDAIHHVLQKENYPEIKIERKTDSELFLQSTLSEKMLLDHVVGILAVLRHEHKITSNSLVDMVFIGIDQDIEGHYKIVFDWHTKAKKPIDKTRFAKTTLFIKVLWIAWIVFLVAFGAFILVLLSTEQADLSKIILAFGGSLFIVTFTVFIKLTYRDCGFWSKHSRVVTVKV